MEIMDYKTRNDFRVRLEARVKNSELIKARESLGLTMEKAAEKIGISYGTLCQFENLRAYPGKETQERICGFYRERGHFMLEEDIFPRELKYIKARKMIIEKEIPKEKMISLSYINRKLLPINYNTPREELDKKFLKQELSKILRLIPEREAKILTLRFGLNGEKSHTLKETGEKLGVTNVRVRQIEDVALKRLRHNVKRGALDEFF